jgi:hypothetical protein
MFSVRLMQRGDDGKFLHPPTDRPNFELTLCA